MIKVLVVDNHSQFREELQAILEAEADIEVAGLACSVEQALELIGLVNPDIVLIDIRLPDGSGAEATRRILVKNPGCKVLFLTASEQDEDMIEAVRSGAKGYLHKNLPSGKLIAAIHSVYEGGSALSRAMTRRVMEELSRSLPPDQPVDPRLARLTNREMDVLCELAAGKSNREIAALLFLAENTVKYHMHSIIGKLELPDRKSVALFAREQNLIKDKA